jgi:hypothetical protein
VVGRINAIENSLVEQSQSIVSLREKSLSTDEHLQRLLLAVEKLCSRAESQSQMSLLQAGIEGDHKPEPPSPPPAEAAMKPPSAPVDNPQEAFAAQYQRDLEHKVEPQPVTETEMAIAVTSSSAPSPRPEPSVRHGFRPVGMAILGLAILGFRLIR